LIALIKIVY